MNTIMEKYYPVFESYQALRNQLMEALTNDDLAYRPDGNTPTLGELCREIGEIEASYIRSFKTFEQDFSYRNEAPGLASSVERLRAWYDELDGELKEVVTALAEEDIQNRLVRRGPDFSLPLPIQLDVYKEALLIFYGKAWVYLKAMEKPLSEQWQSWIG